MSPRHRSTAAFSPIAFKARAMSSSPTRTGLPRHTRSLLTIGLMVALNRSDEFKLHVRAAFNNGVTRDEIKEVLMQCAIYAGIPAANSAFHMAEEVFAQMDSSAK